MGRKPRSSRSSPQIRTNEQVDTCLFSSGSRVAAGKDEVKAWDFFVAPSSYDQYTPKINNDVNVKIVEDLTATLTKRQLQMFRSTCFGYFLDMPKQIRHNALLHWLMTRQIKPASGDDLWFDVNGYRLHFGLGEFGLVSGLKCTGAVEESRLPGKNRLMQKYFGGMSSLYRFHLTSCFHSKCWKNNDADTLKIAMLYFICTFLFATPTRKDIGCLDLKYIDIVEKGEYDNYPWGVDVFNITKASLDKKIVHKPSSYRHSGFTLAIQAWLCETCPAIAGVIASRVPSV